MTQHRRTFTILVSAGLSAALMTAALAAPASAAKPKPRCAGKVATIVGTNKNEVIRGTRKADVIVGNRGNDKIFGLGGNDVICGGPGNDVIFAGSGIDRAYGATGKDRLYGGPGPDRLFGGPANDKLDGGIGRDACFGGTGGGPRLNCELPAPPATPAPTPDPGPVPVPLTGVLAIAYSDLNGDHIFDTGDVLISKLVDTSGDGEPGKGDTIIMDKYPTTLTPTTLAHFADWGVKSHPVAFLEQKWTGHLYVIRVRGGHHIWNEGGNAETYFEDDDTDFDVASSIQDGLETSYPNLVKMSATSPSQPGPIINVNATGAADDRLIDVELYFTP